MPARLNRTFALVMALVFGAALPLAAAPGSQGTAAGTITDASGLALPGASVRIVSPTTGASAETTSDGQGRYSVTAISGEYELQAALSGFRPMRVQVRVEPGKQTVRDIRLQVEAISQEVTVRGDAWRAPSSRVLVTSTDLDHVPGGLQAGSCNAITELSPSAVMSHDQLHLRGGHQIGVSIDGVPVPSSTIASNFTLLFDPKDVDGLDVERGAYSAEYGDRPYGMIDVLTRSGFDRAKGGRTTVVAGGRGTAEGALAYGDHTDTVAWFAQASGNRTDLGLTPPSLPALHDATWGAGAGTRLWLSRGTGHMLTLTGAVRSDNFAIPFDPSASGGDGASVASGGGGASVASGGGGASSAPTGDEQIERDAYVHAQWTHSGANDTAWSITPYYHFRRVSLDPHAQYSSDDRRVHDAGAKADWSAAFGRHSVKSGVDMHAGVLRDRFSLPFDVGATSGDVGSATLSDAVAKTGVNSAAYIQDVYRPANQVTASVGLRWDRAQAWRTESAVEPRAGLQAALPGTRLVVHVYAGRFFEPPPLEALGVGGAQHAVLGDQAFLLVRAERNTQWETGISAPIGHGSVDVTWYDNHASNYLDHEQLGDSAVFLPVNIAEARLRGLEVIAASAPDKPLRARLVYSHSYAQARGGITGGLGDVAASSLSGVYYLDHDQRDAATASLDWALRAGAWAHLAVEYGSGFLRAGGPEHLPSHVTADLAAGFSFARRWSFAADVLNVTDARYFVNLSSEFNGTHVGRPRTVTMRVCARF